MRNSLVLPASSCMCNSIIQEKNDFEGCIAPDLLADGVHGATRAIVLTRCYVVRNGGYIKTKDTKRMCSEHQAIVAAASGVASSGGAARDEKRIRAPSLGKIVAIICTLSLIGVTSCSQLRSTAAVPITAVRCIIAYCCPIQ